jgi:PAS domain S-box-containing protein
LATLPDIQSAATLDPRGPTGSWVLDLSDQSGRWSPEMFEIFGLDPEMLTPSLDELLERAPPEDAALGFELTRELRDGERSFVEFRFRFRRPGGELRLIEARGWSIPDETGRPVRAVGTARDVTEPARDAIERQRLGRRQAMILHAAGDGIVGLDTGGRVVFCNPALKALMRREGEPLAGRVLHDVVHRNGAGEQPHAIADCPFHHPGAPEVRSVDLAFRRGDGSIIEVAYSLVTVDEPELAGTVISFRDVTARRAASRLLRASLQEVQALSLQRGELLSALAEAEERERLRLAAGLHDHTVQELDALRLRLELAASRAHEDELGAIVADLATQTGAIAEHLRQLMFELMPPEGERDLKAAVESYCKIMLADSPLDYEVYGAARPLSSEKYLLAYRLIQEAIRNAVKHSQAGRLRVDLELGRREMVARVSDDGVGMPDGAQPAPTHAGLRIVCQRAEAAGGSVTFGPGLAGRGFSVEIHLPLEPDGLQ